MPSYPISQFSELEDVMCKVNKRMSGRGSPRMERVKFGSGAKVGGANWLTSVSSGASLGANLTLTFLSLFSFSREADGDRVTAVSSALTAAGSWGLFGVILVESQSEFLSLGSLAPNFQCQC